jgi:hypothetical protein
VTDGLAARDAQADQCTSTRARVAETSESRAGQRGLVIDASLSA